MKSFQFEKRQGETVNIQNLTAFLERQMPLLKNGHWQITIEKPTRNNDQNALFWVYLGCLSEGTGQAVWDVYTYICDKYNHEHCLYNAEGVFKSGGTSKLNTKQFADLITNTQVEGAELGIVLLSKGDVNFEEFYNEYRHYIR